MTREEAIDIIKCLAWHTRPNEEDIEMAIKALEQEQRWIFCNERLIHEYISKVECCDECFASVPFSEDEYTEFDDRPQDIKYLTQKYKRISKIAEKSRADYELEIRDLKAKLGAMKVEVNKARNNGIKKRYGDGFVSLLKKLKDELNKFDFENMTGSMDL